MQAQTLAEVQAAVADADLSGIPSYDLPTVPEALLADLDATGDWTSRSWPNCA